MDCLYREEEQLIDVSNFGTLSQEQKSDLLTQALKSAIFAFQSTLTNLSAHMDFLKTKKYKTKFKSGSIQR